jgi:prophage regulatory protein
MNAIAEKPAGRARSRAAAALPVQPLIVDRATAAAKLSVSERTLEELVRTGVAPQPRQLSPNRVGWRVRELEEFAASLPVSQVLPPRNTGRRPAS